MYSDPLYSIRKNPKTWTITGVAGFIGSNLLETLLKNNQTVFGLDNFSKGFRHNLDDVKTEVTSEQWSRFTFYEGDICDLETCLQVCYGTDYVLHQAAWGSVSLSLEQPLVYNFVNVSGFLNMLIAAKECQCKRFVYASSSSVYGDNIALPKIEEKIGNPLSPYAATKQIDELYARVMSSAYGIDTIGLRYFNVFGKRQNPDGSYAAVIPKWIDRIKNEFPVTINGDGKTTRDFCYIDNVIQANIKAALTNNTTALNKAYNIAYGENVTLLKLYDILCEIMGTDPGIIHTDFRKGDIRDSKASIANAEWFLGYDPQYSLKDGLKKTIEWYMKHG